MLACVRGSDCRRCSTTANRKSASLARSDEVGDQGYRLAMSLIDGGPHFARFGIDRQAYRIPDAGCVNAHELAVGCIQDVGAVEFLVVIAKLSWTQLRAAGSCRPL